jgi:predicted ATPase
VIASIAFRDFKALRNASVRLAPFNLVLGPNGSGKSSLIESLLRLRGLTGMGQLSPAQPVAGDGTAEMVFRFSPPHDQIEIQLSCVDATVCNAIHLSPPDASDWPALRGEILRIRSFVFDHAKMGQPAPASESAELAGNGANLASYLAGMRRRDPAAYEQFVAEALRLFPEYSAFSLTPEPNSGVGLQFTLIGEVGVVGGEDVSQGTLHVLGILALAMAPEPPSVVCFEEIDRGVHPRMLREVRDAFYRLAYPDAFGLARRPVQVITTTHSPYMLDLFRDHPEEVVITQKHGREAHFERLADRADLVDILAEGTLGDLWFSGILGGVPEART